MVGGYVIVAYYIIAYCGYMHILQMLCANKLELLITSASRHRTSSNAFGNHRTCIYLNICDILATSIVYIWDARLG
jgi:hypothetical protein